MDYWKLVMTPDIREKSKHVSERADKVPNVMPQMYIVFVEAITLSVPGVKLHNILTAK